MRQHRALAQPTSKPTIKPSHWQFFCPLICLLRLPVWRTVAVAIARARAPPLSAAIHATWRISRRSVQAHGEIWAIVYKCSLSVRLLCHLFLLALSIAVQFLRVWVLCTVWLGLLGFLGALLSLNLLVFAFISVAVVVRLWFFVVYVKHVCLKRVCAVDNCKRLSVPSGFIPAHKKLGSL